MDQEQIELLLRDLSSRLPYGVKILVNNRIETLQGIDIVDKVVEYSSFLSSNIEEVKPYLFPLSSITEEQAIELYNLFGISIFDSIGADYIKVNEVTGITFFLNRGFDIEMHLGKLMNWLHSNHFDYGGLIPMGLANDATGLNIY